MNATTTSLATLAVAAIGVTASVLTLIRTSFPGIGSRIAKSVKRKRTEVVAKARGVSVYSIECLRRLDAQCALKANRKDATYAEFSDRVRLLIESLDRRELHLVKHTISSVAGTAVFGSATITATDSALTFSSVGGRPSRDLPMSKQEGRLVVSLFVSKELADICGDDSCSMSAVTADRLISVFGCTAPAERIIPADKWDDDLMP